MSNTQEIIDEILKRKWAWFTPKAIVRQFDCTLYFARKVTKAMREQWLVEYDYLTYEWCDWNCTNESTSYCDCWPTPPPLWVWKIK